MRGCETQIPPQGRYSSVASSTQLSRPGSTGSGRFAPGLAFLPPDLLFFAAGGLAYGEVRTTTTLSNLDGFNCTGLGAAVYCGSGATSGVSIGWTAGGGLEYAFARQWTVKAEYLYLDLGSQSVTFVDRDVAGSSLTATSKFTAQMVRAGLNYRF